MDNAQENNSGIPQPPVGCYPDSEKDTVAAETSAEATDAFPAIANWKTSIGMSVLGCVIASVCGGLIAVGLFAAIVSFLGRAHQLVSYEAIMGLSGMLAGSIWTMLGLLYALIIYPSFFKEKPLFKSSKLISFCNMLFGGIIFGCLWNANLTRCRADNSNKINASRIVFIILASLQIALTLANFLIVQLPSLQEVRSWNAGEGIESQTAKTPSSSNGTRYVDREYEISFLIPDGWHEKDLNANRDFTRAKFVTDGNNTAAVITYAVGDMWSELSPKEQETFDPSDINMSAFSPEDFSGSISSFIADCRDETSERVNLGGKEYFMYSGTGRMVAEAGGKSIPVAGSALIHIEDGYLILFQFIAVSEEDYEKYVPDFIELAGSVVC